MNDGRVLELYTSSMENSAQHLICLEKLNPQSVFGVGCAGLFDRLLSPAKILSWLR